MKSNAVIAALLVTSAFACSGSSGGPPSVASGGFGGGGSSADPAGNCTVDSDDGANAGNGDFDASLDAGLGIGTTNPTTPPAGAAAFRGDATVSVTSSDAGSSNPCR